MLKRLMGHSEPVNDQIPGWFLRAVFLVIGAVLVTFFSIVLLIELQELVVWFVIALFLSFAIEPMVNILERRGWKRGLATGLLLLFIVLSLFVFVAAMVPLVIRQVQDLINSAPGWIERSATYLGDVFGVQLTVEDLLKELEKADLSVGGTATSVASNVLDVSSRIISILFQTFTILFFTFYLVAEGPKLRRKLMTFMPAKQQKAMLVTWEVAMEKTGGYLYSRILLGLISAIATFIVLTIIGTPFALPLALWMGFISQFIPVVGTYIAASVPLLVALLQSPTQAIIFIIFVVLYQQVENYLLSPKITARTMQLHPAVAIAAAIAGATLRGPIGAILALPIAAILQAIVGTYLTRHDIIVDDSDLIGDDEPEKPKKAKQKSPQEV